MSNGPRLPSLPIAGGGYDPPAAEPSPLEVAQARDDARTDIEQIARTFDLPSNGTGAPGTPSELLVYKTQRPWRACDVFVRLNPPAAGFSSQGCLSVFVYAWSRGVRSLVASGRVAALAGANPLDIPKWIAAARTVAEAFEVTILFTQASAAAHVIGTVDVSVIASNEAVEVPADLGAVPAGDAYLQANNASGIGVNLAGVQFPARVELVSCQATNLTATPRLLVLCDSNSVNQNPIDGVVQAWPMGAVSGGGSPFVKMLYRARKRLQLVTTDAAFTVVADCSISAMVR